MGKRARFRRRGLRGVEQPLPIPPRNAKKRKSGINYRPMAFNLEKYAHYYWNVGKGTREQV